jgi:hypothetical protein
VTHNSKKENERRVLSRVLAALRETSKSEPQAREAPDFILQLRGQSVGVEITTYRSEEVIEPNVKRRSAESEWETLRAAAQNFWSQKLTFERSASVLCSRDLYHITESTKTLYKKLRHLFGSILACTRSIFSVFLFVSTN